MPIPAAGNTTKPPVSADHGTIQRLFVDSIQDRKTGAFIYGGPDGATLPVSGRGNVLIAPSTGNSNSELNSLRAEVARLGEELKQIKKSAGAIKKSVPAEGEEEEEVTLEGVAGLLATLSQKVENMTLLSLKDVRLKKKDMKNGYSLLWSKPASKWVVAASEEEDEEDGEQV